MRGYNKFLLFVFLFCASCSSLSDYERKYTIGYEDDEGHRVDVGVTIIPLNQK